MAFTCRVVVVLMLVLWWTPLPAAAQLRPAAPEGAPAVPEIASEPQGFVAEPVAIKRVAIFSDRHFSSGERTSGFYPDIKNMIPGSGWIGGGPGYRQWYAKDSVFLDASAGMSSNGYKSAQARVELPKFARSRIALGSQIKWQDFTEIDFYGEGPESAESNLTEYRLRSTNVVGYATLRPVRWVGIGATLGWLTPSILDSTLVAGEQPSFVHSEASISADTRDFPGRPTGGVLLRAAMANYSDRDAGSFSFRRYEAEGAHFLPLSSSRIVVALRGWLVASDTDAGQAVPFYLAPSLGGNNSLRGYSDYRFHDRNLLLLNIETRVALMTHMDAALFFDAGNVAARVDDLDLGRQSYGAGVRFHTRRMTFGRVDVARSDEGWRAIFSLCDPLNLARISRRTATAPFFP
jgi:hypothetical protein